MTTFRYRARSYPMPRTRDPIVNTPLLPIGPDARGVERFWISTYNRCTGCTGLRVDEWGNARAYRFPWQHEGFYSSAYVGDDTLWLCGRLDRLVRLDLRTGRYTAHETGTAKARVFEGMIHDAASGKVLVASRPYQDRSDFQPTVAVAFDTRARRTVKAHEIDIPEGVSRCSFANGDGTYSLLLQIPGEALLRWNPRCETIEHQRLSDRPVWTQDGAEKRTCRLVGDDAGRWYFPGYGWFNPATRAFEQTGPRPAREMAWLFRDGSRAIGALNEGSSVSIHAWDLASGRVDPLFKIPDCDIFNVSRTRSDRLVAVNAFGVFFRFDLKTHALESSRRLPTDGTGDALAVCRIDRDHVLGAPYISSRFWELNLRTGRGTDCGRAMDGWGQIDFILPVGDKVYMAAYAGGELLEYDPRRPLCFPDNPRPVADPPHGMRPVAIAMDGRTVFYSCSADYGRLGSTLTRYDTVTGRADYAVRPLGDQQIRSLFYDRRSRSLVCGTTFHSDSMDCPPTESTCRVARIDAATLTATETAPAPAGIAAVTVIGPLDARRWLCQTHAHVSGPGTAWQALERGRFSAFADGPGHAFPPGSHGGAAYAGKPGLFVLNVDDRLEVWDMRLPRRIRSVFRPFDPARVDGYRFSVEGESLLVLRSTELLLVENAFRGL